MKHLKIKSYILMGHIKESMTDDAIAGELGQRLAQARLEQNRTQQELAEHLGINRMSYNRLERGQGKVITLIAALRALGKLDQLDAFLPNEPFSPMEALKMGRPQRMRARPKDKTDAQDEGADW